ncbi:MAG: helix-turn-helix transcriptional regulator [Spirochaetota bacterium]
MKTVRANIKPALLTWARESLGFSLADAAKKLNVAEDRLRAWEVGEDRPTINQLRKMTDVYKRPLAVFFLPEPPKGFQVMKDFRRMPGTIAGLYSPQLLLDVRCAQERRQLALDLLSEIDEKPKTFTLKAELTDNPEQIGAQIRKDLSILVIAHGVRPTGWTDDEIQELAKRYSVSRESLVRRLLTLGRTTDEFYKRIRADLLAEIQMLKERKRQQAKKLEYRKNPPREAISDLGRSFVGLVMLNYYQDRLTLSEVSEHLGVRVRHVPRVQEFMGT